ncbi:MAG: hypothetical protein PSN34_04375 [Urechidicola sp.]|nr:hypothetical protein [Urechidicola sp.]
MKKVSVVLSLVVLSFVFAGCPSPSTDLNPDIGVLSPDENAVYYIYDAYQDIATLKADLTDDIGLEVVTIGVYNSDDESVFFDRIFINDNNPDTAEVKSFMLTRTFQTDIPGIYKVKFSLTDLGNNSAVETLFIEFVEVGPGDGDTDGPT